MVEGSVTKNAAGAPSTTALARRENSRSDTDLESSIGLGMLTETSRRTKTGAMPLVQIIAVTTADIGPSGPIKKFYAVGMQTPDLAMTEMEKRLKSGEVAHWIDARSLSVAPGEVRLI